MFTLNFNRYSRGSGYNNKPGSSVYTQRSNCNVFRAGEEYKDGFAGVEVFLQDPPTKVRRLGWTTVKLRSECVRNRGAFVAEHHESRFPVEKVFGGLCVFLRPP